MAKPGFPKPLRCQPECRRYPLDQTLTETNHNLFAGKLSSGQAPLSHVQKLEIFSEVVVHDDSCEYVLPLCGSIAFVVDLGATPIKAPAVRETFARQCPWHSI